MRKIRTEKNEIKIAPPRIGTLLVFVLLLGVFGVLNRVIQPPKVLTAERRHAAKLPALTLQSIANAEFMNGFEDFAADSFAFRETFRSLRSATVLYAWMQTDSNRLYHDPLVGAGRFEAVQEAALRRAAAKLRLAAVPLQALDMQIYYACIPDKSIYAARKYPGFDAAQAAAILREELPDFSEIDVTTALAADAYYRTDLHWRQEKLEGVLTALGNASAVTFDTQGLQLRSAGSFRGNYAGQLSLPMQAEELLYLQLPQSVTARYLHEKSLQWEAGELYDVQAIHSIDPYAFFLNGAQALIHLENPNARSDKTLYLFRDSYASALAPLLASGYRNIYLIDLRYIHYSLLSQYITWEAGADLLFLYSAQILNNPDILMI